MNIFTNKLTVIYKAWSYNYWVTWMWKTIRNFAKNEFHVWRWIEMRPVETNPEFTIISPLCNYAKWQQAQLWSRGASCCSSSNGLDAVSIRPADWKWKKNFIGKLSSPSRKRQSFFVIVTSKNPWLCGTFSLKNVMEYAGYLCNFMQLYAMKLRELAKIVGTCGLMKKRKKNTLFH